MVPRILLVIDPRPQPGGHGLGEQVRGILSQAPQSARILLADRTETAVEMMRIQRPGVALLPVTPPDGEELAILTRLLGEAPVVKVIALVPTDQRVLAVRAVARGAHEVCRLPVDGEELAVVIDRAFQRADLELEGRKLETGDAPPTLRALREVTERRALLEALARSGGNLSATARELGVSRPTLYSLLRQHGIRSE